jgi:integrase
MTLKMILLTGQRPGEVSHMHRAHIVDGWWMMPGNPDLATGWPGTKNGNSHRVWLSKPALALLREIGEGTGLVFGGPRGNPVSKLPEAMRSICKDLGADRATPHDLRRTFSTTVTALGFGVDAMNRVTNHVAGGISSVYDRHAYAEENKRIWEAVAAHVMALVEGKTADNVVNFRQ